MRRIGIKTSDTFTDYEVFRECFNIAMNLGITDHSMKFCDKKKYGFYIQGFKSDVLRYYMKTSKKEYLNNNRKITHILRIISIAFTF